ncbi:type II secretion system protein GspL [Uliginosibacterium sp. H3]|uniref:Type II secretion system protein GspL n=1 Tax=Uliginosibacterium silvisoli TaxID=3114758 RepID=A0ABU6K970_9RHOO|nr:type II secretion system protein GspL [Uliginosibacterium sp. H3]
MTTLRILISDAWPDQAEAHWVVLDQNKVVSSGHSTPANWPRATRTEAILTGAQVGWAQARLPQAKAREQLRALPFAMEEQLLREPDSQHFTPTWRDGENWSVLVIARERLKRLTAQFAALGRPLDAAWSAIACLPLTPNGWTLAVDHTHCLLRLSAARAVIDDMPPPDAGADALPAIVSMLLSQAQAQGSLPARIVTMGAGSQVTKALAAHQLEVVPEATWLWHEVPDDAANLLHDEFRAAHARGQLLNALRPALILLAMVLIGHLVLGIGSALLRQQDLKEIKSRMTQLARTQLPGRALQDPSLQLHRELQSQRQQRAQLADDDALAMLSDLAVALGSDAMAALQAVHYDGGTLVVTLAKPIDIPALQSRLEARGVKSAVRNANVLALQRSAS